MGSKQFALCLLFALSSIYVHAQQKNSFSLVKGPYNLAPKHSLDTQYFAMESVLQMHAPDGSIQRTDVYRLFLRCNPSKDPKKGDQYTCMKFTYEVAGKGQKAIPTLEGWTYQQSTSPKATDDSGQVFGISHAKFDGIKDDNGTVVPVENKYHIYNAFIDFHAMQLFVERTPGDSGIQKMSSIGDSIVHMSAYSKPPVNLGAEVAKGSYFQNGRITLMFKGLSHVNGKSCAIIEYDSGKSSFYMLTKPSPNMDISTKGSSHYWGDIFKDLKGGWIQKASLHELVVSETTVPGLARPVSVVVERTITINNTKRPISY